MEITQQIELLNIIGQNPSFTEIVERQTGDTLKAEGVEILQINVGRQCNLSCRHCHFEAGMNHTESMPGDIFEKCLDIIKRYDLKTVDITGGTPELNPNLEWFLKKVCNMGMRVILRSNLVLLGDDHYRELIDLLVKNKIEIITSLPSYVEQVSDRQRGKGNYKKIIESMRMLNDFGYGHAGTDLILNIVYNPVGAYLPGAQNAIEHEYREHLLKEHVVVFNKLFCITNMPIGRYLSYLVQSGNYEEYFNELYRAYNPGALDHVMCKNTISVGWDGFLYDCDFNQALGLKVNHGAPDHIDDFTIDKLAYRQIVIKNHCYGCCAGAGSSCQGQIPSARA